MRDENFYYGVVVNEHIYPICDGAGHRVLIHIPDFEQIPMTPESAAQYGFHHLSWNLTRHHQRLLAAANRRNRQP